MINHFMDFKLDTEKGAFTPRFETEILVEKAIRLIDKRKPVSRKLNILDIGTGSGNIAISLTKYIPSSRLVALDISDTALRVAKKNAARYGLESSIEFISSDLFENIRQYSNEYFDIIISNPPYISLEDFLSLPIEVKDDPYVALFGGKDGLKFYRRIVKESPEYLKKGGILLMEIGYNQSRDVTCIIEESHAYGDVEIYKDYSGVDRIIKAEKYGT